MATIKNRKAYVKTYHNLGEEMFPVCTIPTVGDFVKAYGPKADKKTKEKIENLTKFTGNTKDIEESVNRRNGIYSDAESKKFMNSVIAANITDITDSGWFYKKLISSCDDMTIIADDCCSAGEEFECPIDEATFNYKIKNRFITELNDYVEDYKKLPKKGTIHVRTFLTCKKGPRHFCAKCAGLYRRSYDTSFVPKNIGIYATYMITEHATQASLDSMNKGVAEKLNVLLEQKIEKPLNVEDAKDKIRVIIDQIGDVGVESRFYEIALLSRYRNGEFSSLQTSFLRQEDIFGAFIYSPRDKIFNKMIETGSFNANSMKTKIAFDAY